MKFVSVTPQMKATEMYIPVLLFVTPCKGAMSGNARIGENGRNGD